MTMKCGTTHDPWNLCTHSRALDLTFDTYRKSRPVGDTCRYPFAAIEICGLPKTVSVDAPMRLL